MGNCPKKLPLGDVAQHGKTPEKDKQPDKINK